MKTANLTNQIRNTIVSSTQAQLDIAKLETYSHREDYVLIAQFNRAFLGNDFYDSTIESFLETMDEREIHNHVAALSYRIPNFGISHPSLYLMEEAKVSLASTILHTYMTLFGYAKAKENVLFSPSGKKSWYTVYYIGDESLETFKKNQTFGLHFEPGQAPITRISGKAGIPGLKTPREFVRFQKQIASMKFRIVKDVNFDQLFNWLKEQDEYISTTNGDFLVKGRKVSKLERKLLIKERVEQLEARYLEAIEQVKILIDRQETSNTPYYLSIHFDYRGREIYDLTHMILNPHSKIGKRMWEAFAPRELNIYDYQQIVFSIMSGIDRVNPNDAEELFESDRETILNKYTAPTGDFFEDIYRTRVVNALSDYENQLPNSSFLFADYTNGGAIHFSTGMTREPKAMGICNMFDVSKVNDAHGSLRKAFNTHTSLKATRDDIKKAVSQGIIAGISPRSAVSKIKDFFLDEHGEEINITEPEYSEIAKDVYGNTAPLFYEYNKFGNSLLDNEHSYLPFKTKDGFPARSIAFIKSQEVKAYYVSVEDRPKSDLREIKLHRDMPMKYVRDGKRLIPYLEGEYAQAKVSGFLANSTHSIDGTSIRALGRSLINIDAPALFIHDNIATSGFAQKVIRDAAKLDILENFEQLPFLSILKQVTNGRRTVPNFVLSDATTFAIGDNFLQA